MLRRATISSLLLVLALGLGSWATHAAEEEPAESGSFGPAGSLAEARTAHTATLLPDGSVLIVGGWGEDGYFASAEVWDPTTASFGPAGSLADARQFHTATLLPDGRVLIVGGYERDADDRSAFFASAEVWDPATASFGPAGSLAEARRFHTATLLPDGRVLVVGGEFIDNGRVIVAAEAEVWDPATASFGPAGSLAEARWGHSATLLPDGRVLVVGGRGVSDFLASAEVWDPATASFGPAGSLAEARLVHTATLLPDGRVLIVGGGVGDPSALPSAEVWDPATASFGPAGWLAEARSFHTATLLPDGRVLVVGGRGEDDPSDLPSAEVWDPATASFGPAGSLAEARWGHSATLLPDGRVLVVGGQVGGQQGNHPVASAEVWEPSDG